MSNLEQHDLINTTHNRITYVEPNDFEGRIDGVPLPPDYTDFCIFFDLIVEVSSRFKQDAGKTTDSDETYIFSWGTKRNEDDDKPKWVSFLSGSEAVDYKTNLLSTYYTDIHMNEILNKRSVEGLGIESATISYENYYTPTIKIRFVDVRGYSLFGGEETLHRHEVLKEDTVFGAFFTYPYPKFKLMVKGFYGKAVTYQLTLLNFNARFNSKTGNFEIDTTFVGYDFGLIADVPIAYVIAAPNSSYAGSVYWDGQCASNPYWRMGDGKPPTKFTDIAIAIRGALKGNSTQSEVVDAEILLENEEKATELNTLKDEFHDFAFFYNRLFHFMFNLPEHPEYRDTKLYGYISDSFSGVDELKQRNRQTNIKYGLFNEMIQVSHINAAAKHLMDKYDVYKQKYPDTKIPDIFTALRSNDATNQKVGSYKSVLDENLVFDPSDDKEFKVFKREFKMISDFYDAFDSEDIGKRETIKIGGDVYNETDIYKLAGFMPTIGNVFKTLYCHLETFTHMFYTCERNIQNQIQNGDRTFEKLGIESVKNTDYDYDTDDVKKNIAYPFPAVFREERRENDGSVDANSGTETLQTVTWVGELKNRKVEWEEQRFVEAIALAITRSVQSADGETGGQNHKPLPFIITPNDLNYGNVAPIASIDKVDSIAGYLALRAALLFGVSNFKDSDAETLGKLEALSLYDNYKSKSLMKRILFEQVGNTNVANELYNMATCNSTVIQDRLVFEKSDNLLSTKQTNKRKRQPFFVESGDRLVYTYSNANNSSALIPNHLLSWNEMQDRYGSLEYNGGNSENSAYYTINVNNKQLSAIYAMSDKKAFELLADTKLDNSEYTNINNYNVFYGGGYGDGEDFADEVIKVYDNLKSGEVSLYGYKEDADSNKFSKIVDNYWSNRFSCLEKDGIPGGFLSKGYSSYGISDNMLLNDDGTRADNKEYVKAAKSGVTQKIIGNADGITYDADKHEFNINSKDLFVLAPTITYLSKDNKNYRLSVFGSRFYYAQNKFDFQGGVTLIYKGVEFTKNALKAFVFLMSMPYGANLKDICGLRDNCGKITILPRGAVIKLGAVLWWSDWRERYKNDPLQYPKGIKRPSEDEIIFNKVIDEHSPRNYEKINVTIGSIDVTVKNLLIEKFIYFVEHEWSTIMDNCELKQKDGSPMTEEYIEEMSDKSSRYYTADTNCEYECFSNIGGKMSRITPLSNFADFNVLLSEKNPAQDTMKAVYFGKVCAQSSKVFDGNHNGVVSISKSTYKKYLNGVVAQMKAIVDSEDVLTETEDEPTDDGYNIDIKTQIYVYLKNMWERWFVNNDEKDFSVRKYMQNTIFIDSMFRNTYNKLHINCEILLRALDAADGTRMTFQFLADIANHHHCMFFGFPDYLGIGGAENDVTYNAMKTIFKPLPYSQIGDFATQNKFVVMFTHKPSEIAESMNSYQYDSFDIYSETGGVLDTFNRDLLEGVTDTTDEVDVQVNRYGYNIPSFGLAMGRQNNHIFKNVSVGMSNPVQTEQTINALAALAQRGRGEGGISTIFHGQDLWNVYSGYSYTCDVEMMGNAQISPLMYFQLTGMPMFRGAYMIYGVTHTIKPGDMTTTFKAMKMSKRTLPWCKEWFTKVYVDDEGNVRHLGATDGYCDLSEKEYKPLEHEKALFVNNRKPLGRTKSTYTETDALSNTTTVQVKIHNLRGGEEMVTLRVNKALVDGRPGVIGIFNDIFEKVPDFRINPKTLYSYSYRFVKNPDGTDKPKLSNHSYGVAIDINPNLNIGVNDKGGNPYVGGGKPVKGKECSVENDNMSIRTLTHPVVKIFMDHEWGWGGTYGDYMHFSYFDGR